MGYRVVTIDELKKQNENLKNSRPSSKVARGLNKTMYNKNLRLIANAPTYDDIYSTIYSDANTIQEEHADEIKTKQKKKGGVKLVSTSRNRV